jgi:hypothetical protein
MISLKFFLEKRKRNIQDFLLEYGIVNATELLNELNKMQIKYDLDLKPENLFEITSEEKNEVDEEIEPPKNKKKKNSTI